jgi:hypothetical protein
MGPADPPPEESVPPPRPPRRWLPWAVGLAAVIAVAAFTGAFVAARYEARLGVMARQMARQKAQVGGEQALLRDRLAAAEGLAHLLRDPATRVLDLRPTATAPAAGGRLVWHPGRGGWLLAGGLPPAEAGAAYVAWVHAGGAPRAAGALAIGPDGQGTVRLEAAPGAAPRVTVTREAAADAPAPSGPIVLASP